MEDDNDMGVDQIEEIQTLIEGLNKDMLVLHEGLDSMITSSNE
jgi:hypothetical protein